MKEENKNLSLDEKLLELKKLVNILQKDSEGHGYTYVSEEKILLKINDKMIDLGLKLTPRFVPNTLHSEVVKYQNSKNQEKTDILVRSEIEFVWKDINSKEVEIVPWGLLGQQADASQALGSGLTYSNRYFLLKYFNIATSEDDPDKIRKELKKEEEKNKLTPIQLKIKEMFAIAIKIFQTKENIYKRLGTTKQQFLYEFNEPQKQQILLEQLELIIKEV